MYRQLHARHTQKKHTRAFFVAEFTIFRLFTHLIANKKPYYSPCYLQSSVFSFLAAQHNKPWTNAKSHPIQTKTAIIPSHSKLSNVQLNVRKLMHSHTKQYKLYKLLSIRSIYVIFQQTMLLSIIYENKSNHACFFKFVKENKRTTKKLNGFINDTFYVFIRIISIIP